MNSSDPSSLRSRNVYSPVVGTVRVAIACTTKFCVKPPNAASPSQSIVGLSSSTFGVWPVLIVADLARCAPRWNTRCVTPGSCGGGSCARARRRRRTEQDEHAADRREPLTLPSLAASEISLPKIRTAQAHIPAPPSAIIHELFATWKHAFAWL